MFFFSEWKYFHAIRFHNSIFFIFVEFLYVYRDYYFLFISLKLLWHVHEQFIMKNYAFLKMFCFLLSIVLH
jgi:hypothetical protein